jgi:curved DNA-binding protein CbpA
MTSPHEVLGLPDDADEAVVRDRYLQLVREFPPERAPERFAAIRAAYDELRDPARRLERQLFSPRTSDSFEALQANLLGRLRSARMPYDVLLSLAEGP